MRFFTPALGVVALLSCAVASPQDSYNSAVTSATQVVTITRTVSRVVQTEYATKTQTPSAYTTVIVTTKTPVYVPKPSVLPPPYTGNNDTTPVVPTGVVPSTPSTPSSPVESPIFSGAAKHFGAESLGVAAVAAIVGFMAI